jgi:anti-sigma B factor antagonist
MGLRVESEEHEGYAVIRPHGELDIATVARLRDTVIATIAGGCADIVVDLTGVTFIDSSGLGVLVGAMKRTMHAGGRLVVTGVDAPGVHAAFRASGLSRIVAAERSPDLAVAALRG